jgi:opacity protein-like surface antigen
MRRNVLFAVLVVAVFYSTNLYAQQIDGNQFYVGIGGSYVSEDFKYSQGFDDTWGGNVKIGYKLHPMADIEFDFDYLDTFDQEESFALPGVNVDGRTELDVMTYMVALKGNFPISSEKVKLFVVVGAGVMTADADYQGSVNGISVSGGSDLTDFCSKVGLGFDLFATPNISIGVEGNYTLGFFDVEDIRYFQLTLGAAFHF